MATLTTAIDADDHVLSITGDVSAAETTALYSLDDEIIKLTGFESAFPDRNIYAAPRPPWNRNRWIVSRGTTGSEAAAHGSGTLVLGVNDAYVAGIDLDPPDPLAESDATDGPGTILAYDEFALHSDGVLTGKVPLIGSVWVGSGPQPPTVTSGLLTSSGTGYAFQTAPETVAYIEAIVTFTGTDDGTESFAFGWSDATIENAIHLTVGGTGGFTLSVRKDAGSFDGILDSSQWKGRVAFDGTTRHKFAMYVRGETVIVIGPNGEVYATADARIPGLASNVLFWEPLTSGYTSKVVSVRAIGRAPNEVAIGNGPDMLDVTPMGNDLLYAFRDLWHHMEMGLHPSTGLPALTFGPLRIRTALVDAISIGATSITTRDRLFNGATDIGYGDDAETVTVSAAAGAAPFTATITAAAKAHAAGDYVQGGGNPTGIRPYLDFNPDSWMSSFSGYLNLLQRLSVNGTQVVNTRVTGWTAASGTATRTTFDTSSVTTEQLAQRVKALIDDLVAHGLIGS